MLHLFQRKLSFFTPTSKFLKFSKFNIAIMMSLVWGTGGAKETWGIEQNPTHGFSGIGFPEIFCRIQVSRCVEWNESSNIASDSSDLCPSSIAVCERLNCRRLHSIAHTSALLDSSFFFFQSKSTTELTNGTQPVLERRAGASLGTLYTMMPAIFLLTPVN